MIIQQSPNKSENEDKSHIEVEQVQTGSDNIQKTAQEIK